MLPERSRFNNASSANPLAGVKKLSNRFPLNSPQATPNRLAPARLPWMILSLESTVKYATGAKSPESDKMRQLFRKLAPVLFHLFMLKIQFRLMDLELVREI